MLEIKENMVVCTATSHTNKQTSNTQTLAHGFIGHHTAHTNESHLLSYQYKVETVKRNGTHVQAHCPHEPQSALPHKCIQDVVGDGEEWRQGQQVIMSRRCAAYERCNQYAGWVRVLQSRVSPGVRVVHFPAMHLGSTIQVPIAKHGGVCVGVFECVCVCVCVWMCMSGVC